MKPQNSLTGFSPSGALIGCSFSLCRRFVRATPVSAGGGARRNRFRVESAVSVEAAAVASSAVASGEIFPAASSVSGSVATRWAPPALCRWVDKACSRRSKIRPSVLVARHLRHASATTCVNKRLIEKVFGTAQLTADQQPFHETGRRAMNPPGRVGVSAIARVQHANASTSAGPVRLIDQICIVLCQRNSMQSTRHESCRKATPKRKNQWGGDNNNNKIRGGSGQRPRKSRKIVRIHSHFPLGHKLRVRHT